MDGGPTPGLLSVVSGREVEVLAAAPAPGVGDHAGDNRVAGDSGTNGLPVLSTVEQIQWLAREQAQRGFPVKIRGVITCVASRLYQGFVLQDATRGVYVAYPGESNPASPRLGEVWEIEGVTGPGEFAPLVQARTMTCVGEGRLPEPVLPTWPQLMNGSLDTQFVELRGMVTAVEADALTLLTHWGKLRVMTAGLSPRSLASYENTLVRIRGCLLAVWDAATHRVKVGEILIGSASINVDRADPADLFAAPTRRAADLLLFDLKAGEFQRVKVAGQFISGRDGEYFVMDGTHGLRVLAKQAEALAAGDLVEVSGFPELGGPSPVLREAVARRVGRAVLPPPRRLTPGDLLRAECDATRVQVEALLLNLRTSRGDQILELKSGVQIFVARLRTELAAPLAAGSQLELTGVYLAQGGEPAIGKGLDSFELLLSSAGDIRVLARPGWWTFQRLLVALGVLAVVLCGAMLWAFVLKRQVIAQTQVIREQVEREATLEERGRIARELHDSLEQALAGLSLQLNALAGRLPALSPEVRRILETARLMVRHGQEEARRTVRNLRLLALEKADLQTTLAQMAEDAGRDMPVKIRVDISGTPQPLAPKIESHLLRIAQEATTNALKHACAETIALRLHYDATHILLSVRDDGCGFDAAHAHSSKAGHFGLLGMRERAEKVRGRLNIVSSPGIGTTVQVTVGLHPPAPGVEIAS
jgi:signal transduction histidine kinase